MKASGFNFVHRGRYLWALVASCCALTISPSILVAQINRAQGVSGCKASQLLATEDRRESDEIDGGVGNHAMTIAIQNLSSSPCVLYGVPSLSFLDRADHAYSVSVCSNCDHYLFRRQPVKEIVLQPNQWAFVVLGYSVNDGEHGKIPCRYTEAIRLYLPDRRMPLKFDVSQGRDKLLSCGPVVVTSFLEKPPAGGFLPSFTNPQ